MITLKEQHKLLAEDLARAEEAGLVVMINVKYHGEYWRGEFMVTDATATRDVLIQLFGYLKRTYPDIFFYQKSQSIYYESVSCEKRVD